MLEEVSTLEACLNNFDLKVRTQALQALLEHHPAISDRQSFDPGQDKSSNLALVNMHYYTLLGRQVEPGPVGIAALEELVETVSNG